MPGLVSQYPVAPFSTPINGDDLDAAVVVSHDNSTAAAHTSHDSDGTIHFQSSTLAARPGAGVTGRKWVTTDGLRVYLDTGAAWSEIDYLCKTAGGTVAGATTFSSGVAVTGTANELSTDGRIRFSSNFSAAFSPANIYKSAALGLTLIGATGSAQDFFVGDPGGNPIITVATGTRNVLFSNNVSVIGLLSAATLSGSLVTAAQPNITSLGTLTALAVTGDTVSGRYLSAASNVATLFLRNALGRNTPFMGTNFAWLGSGSTDDVVMAFFSKLSFFPGNGVVASLVLNGDGTSTFAGNVSVTSGGANIVGTLTGQSANFSGTVTAANFVGPTSIDANNLTGTNLNAGVVTSSLTSLGTLASLTVTGTSLLNGEVRANLGGNDTVGSRRALVVSHAGNGWWSLGMDLSAGAFRMDYLDPNGGGASKANVLTAFPSGAGAIFLFGSSVTTGAAAGDIVLASGKALRSANSAATSTVKLIELGTASDVVYVGGGGGGIVAIGNPATVNAAGAGDLMFMKNVSIRRANNADSTSRRVITFGVANDNIYYDADGVAIHSFSNTVVTGASAGEVVLANNKGVRGVNVAGNNTSLLVWRRTDDTVGIDGGGFGTVFGAGAVFAGALSGVTTFAMSGALSGLTSLSMNGTLSGVTSLAMTSDLSQVAAGVVQHRMRDTTQAADSKVWFLRNSSAQFLLQAVNDAENNSITALTVTRSGIASVALTFGGQVSFNGFSVNSDMLFVDNTFDIGKTGATRPRDIFASRNIDAVGAHTGASATFSGSVTGGSVDVGVGHVKAGTTTAVTAAGPTTIYTTVNARGFAFVHGSSAGKAFCDLISWDTSVPAVVLVAGNVIGGVPGGRTYSISGSNIQLQMSATGNSVKVVPLEFN